jgi:hypothetical protein
MNQPFYKKIYTDILNKKFPHKIKECNVILLKDTLSFLDIIQLNQRIFGNQEISSDNQRLRSYNTEAILEILEYQKKYSLNNSQLAIHFRLSRNTVTRWKRNFSDLVSNNFEEAK